MPTILRQNNRWARFALPTLQNFVIPNLFRDLKNVALRKVQILTFVRMTDLKESSTQKTSVSSAHYAHDKIDEHSFHQNGS